jgi:hypothetical protein
MVYLVLLLSAKVVQEEDANQENPENPEKLEDAVK